MESCANLGASLELFWQKYAHRFKTKTRDTSEYAFHYLSGLLRMESKRNMAQIGRKTGQSKQNIHHFMSKSPWSGQEVIEALQEDIGQHPVFADSVLIIDESADEKSGNMSAGVGRQYNGRMGKVDNCQVGVFASLATAKANTWIDGELFIPKAWFAEENKARYESVGIPDSREFQTKVELAEQLILRCKERNLPFNAVDMDSLYGRSFPLRAKLETENMEYYADIPSDTLVYVEEPKISYKEKKKGGQFKNPTVEGASVKASELVDTPEMESASLRLRPSERGYLEDTFSRRLVWTVHEGEKMQEWLLIRQSEHKNTYVLSNANQETSLQTMAERKTCRYLIERDNQDCKTEFGWDEFQATKYLAWEHQLAMTIMASWFITSTRLQWEADHPQDETLLEELEVDVLPRLSVANVRELLRAAMPLPQLTTQQATGLVVEHLQNRTKSRRSRLRHLM